MSIEFGSDFFKWFKLFVAVVKLFIEIFGNDNEKNEVKKNHIDV